MTPLLIVLIVLVVLAGIALLAAIGLLLEVLPRLAAKKMRSGPIDEAALSYPESYDELRARVTVQKDLVYPSKYPANKFDLYLPKDADRAHPLPLVVWVHGGGFIAGEKEGTENVMTCLAAAGYAAISLDYPVAPEHRYPAALHAIDAFFAFLPRLSERCPIDLTRIVLGGDSAGAQLAAQFAAKETNAALSEGMRLPRRLLFPLKGLALVSGPFDLPALRRYAKAHDKKFLFLVDLWGRAYFGKLFWHRSRVAKETVIAPQVTKDFPPAFLTDGNEGSFEVQNRALGEALRRQNIPVKELYFAKDGGAVPHDYLFRLAEAPAREGLKELLSFLGETLH